jgi:putative transposase
LELVLISEPPARPGVRIFPNAASCLRLVRALAVEMHRYLNMGDLREHKKEALRMAA